MISSGNDMDDGAPLRLLTAGDEYVLAVVGV